MTRILLAATAALLLGACTSSSGDAAPAPQAPAAQEAAAAVAAPAEPVAPLTLLLTADNRGEYEQCGCKSKPSGGLARRATLIEQSRARNPTVALDAGDALFVKGGSSDDQSRARARLILESMGRMGTAAMAVGERDLAAGVEWLVETAREAKVPLLAGNLVDEKGGKPFEASRLVAAGELQVGVIGVWANGELPAGLEATDAAALVAEEAGRLRAAGADVVIVLAHGGRNATDPLARVAGVDFLLPSHHANASLPFQPGPDGAWILGAGERGRNVLRLDLHPAGEGTFADAGAAERTAREREYMKTRVEEARKRRDAVQDEDAKRALGELVHRLEQRLAELERNLAAAGSLEGRRRFAATEVALVASVGDDEAIAGQVAAFEKAWGLDQSSLQ